jgi:hypothetical protein
MSADIFHCPFFIVRALSFHHQLCTRFVRSCPTLVPRASGTGKLLIIQCLRRLARSFCTISEKNFPNRLFNTLRIQFWDKHISLTPLFITSDCLSLSHVPLSHACFFSVWDRENPGCLTLISAHSCGFCGESILAGCSCFAGLQPRFRQTAGVHSLIFKHLWPPGPLVTPVVPLQHIHILSDPESTVFLI